MLASCGGTTTATSSESNAPAPYIVNGSTGQVYDCSRNLNCPQNVGGGNSGIFLQWDQYNCELDDSAIPPGRDCVRR